MALLSAENFEGYVDKTKHGDKYVNITPFAAIMKVMDVRDEITTERIRQLDIPPKGEGWSYEHDDQHTDGSLAAAAAFYAHPQETYIRRLCEPGDSAWPESWDWSWYKPTSRRRDLVKAAALIMAEIERLDRLGAK